jgi:ankyrin repeat protein
MEGDCELLEKLLNDHVSGTRAFCSIRSRCINGSALLHTAAYFGQIHIIEKLLGIGLDVNLLDYKGATALHRAKDVDTMRVRHLVSLKW